jgi:hypothetical protein
MNHNLLTDVVPTHTREAHGTRWSEDSLHLILTTIVRFYQIHNFRVLYVVQDHIVFG